MIGKIMTVPIRHTISVADATYDALLGLFLPSGAQSWLNMGTFMSATLAPVVGEYPAVEETEWRVESFEIFLQDGVGRCLHGRRIYLVAYNGPQVPYNPLPGVLFSNLHMPAHLEGPISVSRGVGVLLPTLGDFVAVGDVVLGTLKYREVRP